MVTFIIDHHASPCAISGSLDMIAAAFEEVGLNHLLCYEISDRDGEKRRRQGLEETERYLNSHQALVGLHASFTVGDQLLHAAVNLAGKYNSGIHIHVAEDPADQTDCIENHGGVIEG
jgi:cytosine/adenosine deaminase-related metal-dependent hydrolase